MTTTTNKATRTARRNRSAELRRLAKVEAVKRQEALDEAIAPAVQRRDVLDGSGAVLRAARVKRDGVGFSRTDVLSHMAAEINEAREAGAASMFTIGHFTAAKRLRAAWDAAGEGIGLGASDWGRVGGGRATAPSEQAGHSALVAQVQQRVEVEAAAAWLGGLWPAVRDMVLIGMSASAWGAKAGMDRKAVPGYLRAALDRLAEMYAVKREPPRSTEIRTFGPARSAYDARVTVEVG